MIDLEAIEKRNVLSKQCDEDGTPLGSWRDDQTIADIDALIAEVNRFVGVAPLVHDLACCHREDGDDLGVEARALLQLDVYAACESETRIDEAPIAGSRQR